MNSQSNENNDSSDLQNFKRESLLKKAIEHHDEILDGIKTDKEMKADELQPYQVEEIVKRRMICASCPYMSKHAKAAGWYKSIRLDEHCTLCGCVIKFKTACLDCNCGIEDYNKQNPNNQKPLYWEALNE